MTEQSTRVYTYLKISWAIAIPIILVAILIAWASPKKPADPCKERVMAFVQAQHFIKRQLKAPSTAEFPMIADIGNASTPAMVTGGKCGFIVDTYVDAQNSFGATIRARYTVTVAPLGNDEWDLIHFEEH